MIEVKVIVEIPGLPEAIHALASAFSTSQPHTVCHQHGAECQHIDNAGVVNIGGADKNLARATPAAFVNTAPAQTVTVPENGAVAGPGSAVPTQAVPDPAATVAHSAPAPSEATNITLDDLGRAGAALIDAGKMPQLIALLGKFGVQAVTQLKPEQFNAFSDEMKALGAKF